MVSMGKLCSMRDEPCITVTLTAMTQLKDPGHVRKRKQGEISAAQQVSIRDALLAFLKIDPSVPEIFIKKISYIILST